MPHPLELKYGLTAKELLDAMARRFRATVTLEGVVAEVHLERKLAHLRAKGILLSYDIPDKDGEPDFVLYLPSRSDALNVEVKNVSKAAYRKHGVDVAYRVEVQKTRAATADRTTRYYDAQQFHILAVCLGKKTGDWSQFRFIPASQLDRHPVHNGKIAVMHKVPLPDTSSIGGQGHWYADLESMLRQEFGVRLL